MRVTAIHTNSVILTPCGAIFLSIQIIKNMTWRGISIICSLRRYLSHAPQSLIPPLPDEALTSPIDSGPGKRIFHGKLRLIRGVLMSGTDSRQKWPLVSRPERPRLFGSKQTTTHPSLVRRMSLLLFRTRGVPSSRCEGIDRSIDIFHFTY